MNKITNKRALYKTLKIVLLMFTLIILINTNIAYSYSKYNNDDIEYIESNDTNKENKKIAYITIDDGPSKYTEQIIRILNKYNAKVTFFMLDSNMKTYPEKVSNVLEQGHSVGLHSVSHDIKKLYKTNISAKNEFDKNKETFFNITGKDTNLIRLPYGSKPYTSVETYNVLVDSGYSIWDWNIDTKDWSCSSNQIVENVKNNCKNKSEVVILLHEKSQTVEALEPILEYLKEEGYTFFPINQKQTPKNFWLKNLYNE